MTDRPILFSGPMVRAILDGRKTQTRRVLTPQPDPIWPTGGATQYEGRQWVWQSGFDGSILAQPFKIPCAVGDRLWVRESFYSWDRGRVVYMADGADQIEDNWRPSIHMPRWASRLTLTVTDVRVHRLKDISGEDAKAEGVHSDLVGTNALGPRGSYKDNFRTLWDSLNAKRGFGWDVNPWVAAYTFTVESRNIDQ